MLKFAIYNLLSRPMRSLLSLLGLTVAIAGMVGLFSVARGLDRTVTSTFDRISGLVAVQSGAPIPLFSHLPIEWEKEITEIEGVAVVNAEVWQRANIINGRPITSQPRFLFGTDVSSRLKLKSDPYRQDLLPDGGRYLEPGDVGKPNAVISRPIAEQFNVGVGDTLTINGHNLKVVGIYNCGSVLLDVAIIVDINQVRAMTRFDPRSVCAYFIEPTNPEENPEILARRIEDHFRGRNPDANASVSSMLGAEGGMNSLPTSPAGAVGQLARFLINQMQSLPKSSQQTRQDANGAEAPQPKQPRARRSADDAAQSNAKENDPAPEFPAATPPAQTAPPQIGTRKRDKRIPSPIDVRTTVGWTARFNEFSRDLNLFLGVLTSIGLVVAVLSIVNTMLMSVSERIIEFGILKANGWSRRSVMRLIACESATLGFCGGLLGSGSGWVIVSVINSQWPQRVQLYASPGLLAFGLGFATVLGALGGLYPAIWAMRMLPMDAIRRG